MKITIISHNLSSNALGRAYILAKALKKNYEVEFIGLVTDKGIWPPCDTGEFTYIAVKKANFIKNFIEIYRKISGDVIYAVKPLPVSFGVGLAAKIFKKKPLVLDIDDWELGFNIQDYREHKISRLKFVRIYLTLGLLEKLAFLADQITTVSTFLNKKFGGRGVFLPHGRDVEVFDPKKFDVKKEKENLGVKNKKVIMFLGSAKPHKGLENILLSVKRTGIQKIKVLVIGVAENNKWFIDIENKFSDILRSYKFIKFDQIPKFLSAADLVVLPQENNPSTYGQIPAKIFDAMSMEKPIISTNVSDIANILTDCGLVVEAGKVEQLSRAIKHIFENPLEAKRMAKRAREKCIREYSLKVMEKRLEQVFGGLK